MVVALVAALNAPGRVSASDLIDRRASYSLTAWTSERGLPPGDVLEMTQDLEGYLWLGTTGGLVRFDGSQFEIWGSRGEAPLPGLAVTALVAARNGSLWVAFGDTAGGVSQIRDGRVMGYTERDGLPKGPIAALLEDRRGTMWVGGRGGLSRFRADHWERVDSRLGFTDAEVYSLYEASDGTLWVGADVGIYRRRGDRFEPVDESATYVQSFAEAIDHTLWVTDTQLAVRELDSHHAPDHGPRVQLPAAGWRLLRDRRGDLWVAALGGGLLRVRSGAPNTSAVIERFSYEDKIGGSPRAIFEDRDGNVWVGMRGGGLLRLSESIAVTDVELDGLTNDGVRALSVDADGNVWVATGHSLNKFSEGRRQVFSLPQIQALYTDRRGTMWVSTAGGVGRLQNGQFLPLLLPHRVQWQRVTSIAIDASDDLWLCSRDQGLMRWHSGELVQFDGVRGVGRSCTAVAADQRGRIWVGFAAGGVAVYESGAFHSYGEKDGLAGGSIATILQDKSGTIWVSSTAGVSRLQNARFVTLTATNGPFEKIVPSLVQDGDGYLWVGVNSGSAIVRFSPSEMDKVAVNRAYPIEYSFYDASDGLQGDLHWLSHPSAIRGPAGRIWFATGRGVTVVDPHTLPRIRRPATPRIERASADGRLYSPLAPQVLPPRPSALDIGYAALSLSAGSKLRFRHMLEGFSADWVPDGARRRVSYANLPSGRYRFRVAATNDGIWTEAAVWEFSVAQPFYRRTWFFGVSALGAALTIGMAWWLRVRAIHHQFSLVFAERTRVSREIHDTLLQSLGAIGMELETIAQEVDSSQAAAIRSLRRLRRQVAHSVGEARQSIWELRSDRIETRGLAEALRHWTADGSSGKIEHADIVEAGRSRRYSAEIEEQLLRIGQEAITNAVRHSGSKHIHVVVEHQRESVVLRVSDDGRGFVPEDCLAARGEHWGLVTIRERAARIGGHLTIASKPNAGTRVEAIVPVPPVGQNSR